MSASDLAFSLTQLSTYLKAGITLTNSVKILGQQLGRKNKNKYLRILLVAFLIPFTNLIYLFIEHFHSLDDYLKRPYYATFIRVLKMVSFLFSVFLPGLYVAICTFHQEIIPETMIFGITGQESRTPLPVMFEALFIHLIYEIVREAGLRMPKSVGHAISIVGALVIGESAVTAGILSAPMLIVVGLTAVSSFVVSTLYEPVAILRFAFIIVGGLSGFYGIMLCFAAVLINASAINPYGVPFTSPLSPTKVGAWRDLIFRAGWKTMGKSRMQTNKLEK